MFYSTDLKKKKTKPKTLSQARCSMIYQ